MSTSTPKSTRTADIPARRLNGIGRRAQQAPIVFYDFRKIGEGRGSAEEDCFCVEEGFARSFEVASR